MTGLAVALGVLAVVAIVVAVLGRRQLATERLATAAAKQHSEERAGELAASEAARSNADDARTEADARATDAEDRATAADERAAIADARANDAEARVADADARGKDAEARANDADERAADAEARANDAQAQATTAEDVRTSAEDRARSAEQRVADADAAREKAQHGVDADSNAAGPAQQSAAAAELRADGFAGAADGAGEPRTSPEVSTVSSGDGLDPSLMWTLEQLRSERTWRQSVAVGNETSSVFDGPEDPLLEALRVEVDALREDVGAVIDLDVDLPERVGAAGSVLLLRVAQELLAGVVHGSEESTLRIRVDDGDALVTVHSIDEAGRAVEPAPLLADPTSTAEPIDCGVRIRHVITGH